MYERQRQAATGRLCRRKLKNRRGCGPSLDPGALMRFKQLILLCFCLDECSGTLHRLAWLAVLLATRPATGWLADWLPGGWPGHFHAPGWSLSVAVCLHDLCVTRLYHINLHHNARPPQPPHLAKKEIQTRQAANTNAHQPAMPEPCQSLSTTLYGNTNHRKPNML